MFRHPGTSSNMIAAGSGYNGCATATDFHRDSLLQNNHFRGQYNEFSCECKCFFQEKTIFFEKIFCRGSGPGNGSCGDDPGIRISFPREPCSLSYPTGKKTMPITAENISAIEYRIGVRDATEESTPNESSRTSITLSRVPSPPGVFCDLPQRRVRRRMNRTEIKLPIPVD